MQKIIRPWTISAWPLSLKLMLGLLLVSLAPLLIATYAITYRSTEALRQTELESLQQISANVAGRIGQILTDSRRLAAFVSSDTSMRDLIEKPGALNAKHARARMQQLLAANQDIDLARLPGTLSGIVTLRWSVPKSSSCSYS